MSTTATIDDYADSAAGDAIGYRAIHTGAIFGLMLGVFSVVMLFVADSAPQVWCLVALIPVIGMSISLWSIGNIKRQSDQFTGSSLALAGFALSLIFLVTGVGYGAYVYATEVPEGYQRISFETLRPTELQERGGVLVPPDIASLDGKRVFIKGYMRPTAQRFANKFLLVRDNNQCCFGDLSSVKYFDQIAVSMPSSRVLEYSTGVFRIAGVLTVEPQNAARGPMSPVFSLSAEIAR